MGFIHTLSLVTVTYFNSVTDCHIFRVFVSYKSFFFPLELSRKCIISDMLGDIFWFCWYLVGSTRKANQYKCMLLSHCDNSVVLEFLLGCV